MINCRSNVWSFIQCY